MTQLLYTAGGLFLAVLFAFYLLYKAGLREQRNKEEQASQEAVIKALKIGNKVDNQVENMTDKELDDSI